MARKVKNRDEKKIIYVFLEGESEEIYFKNIKKEYKIKLAKFELFRATNGGSDVFNHIKNIFRNKKHKDILPEIDQFWLVFDTEKSFNEKWEFYKDILKKQKIDFNKVKLLMTSKDIEYFFLLHYEYKQPHCLYNDFEKELKKHQINYEKTDEKIIGDIYSKRIDGIKNSRISVLKILKDGNKEYKTIKESNYDFYKIFFETDCAFSLIFQAFEYLESL